MTTRSIRRAQVPVNYSLPECSQHRGRDTELVCSTCNEKLICSKCATRDHRGHTFIDAEEYLLEKKEKLRCYLEHSKASDRPFWQHLRQEVQHWRKDNKTYSEDARTNIIQHRKSLKAFIDQTEEEFLKLCQSNERANAKMLGKLDMAFRKAFSEYGLQLLKAESAILQGSIGDIQEASAQFLTRSLIPDLPDVLVPTLSTGTSFGQLKLLSNTVKVADIYRMSNAIVISIGNSYTQILVIMCGGEEMRINAKIWKAPLITTKCVTEMLLDQHGKLIAFGYEAREKYASLTTEEQGKSFYFRNFLQQLNGQNGNESLTFADVHGKELPASIVMADCIKYCRDEAENAFKDALAVIEFTLFPLTSMLSESAADMFSDAVQFSERDFKTKTKLFSESHAVLDFLRHKYTEENSELPDDLIWFPKGSTYLLVNLEEYHITISGMEILSDGRIRTFQIVTKTGECEQIVFQNFFGILEDLFGTEVVGKTCTSEIREDIISDIKLKIYCATDLSAAVTVKMPIELYDAYEEYTGNSWRDALPKSSLSDKIRIPTKDKLRLKPVFFSEMIDVAFKSIQKHVEEVLQGTEFKGTQHVIVHGKFSSSPFIKPKLANLVPNLRVHVIQYSEASELKALICASESKHAHLYCFNETSS